MGQLIRYVGACWSGSPTYIENEEAARYLLRILYYMYKERLEESIRTLPYTDNRFSELIKLYPVIYQRRKDRLFPKEYPIFKSELEGLFKVHFYDDVIRKFVLCRIEIENDRYYFINYCKKRQYRVADDFYECVLRDGEVILSKVFPPFDALVPLDFAGRCNLRVLP